MIDTLLSGTTVFVIVSAYCINEAGEISFDLRLRAHRWGSCAVGVSIWCCVAAPQAGLCLRLGTSPFAESTRPNKLHHSFVKPVPSPVFCKSFVDRS